METKKKDKYDILKYEKNMLHAKYIVGISCGAVILAIVALCSWNKDFVNQVSFAGTVSSIILSVIAIIMTITGESKTDNAQNKLEDVSDNLENITSNINDSVTKLNKTADIFHENMENMKEDMISSFDNKFDKTEKKLDLIVLKKDDGENRSNKENKDDVNLFKSFIIHIKDEYIGYIYFCLYWMYSKKEISITNYIDDIKKLNLDWSNINEVFSWSASAVFYFENLPTLKDYITKIMEKDYKEYKEKIDIIAKDDNLNEY